MKNFKSSWMVMVFFACTAGLFPCAISFTPNELQAVKGKEIPVTVFVQLSHRNCALALSQTVFETSGVTIQSKGTWETTENNLHKITLSVMPLESQGELRVIRDCGRHEKVTATLKISAN